MLFFGGGLFFSLAALAFFCYQTAMLMLSRAGGAGERESISFRSSWSVRGFFQREKLWADTGMEKKGEAEGGVGARGNRAVEAVAEDKKNMVKRVPVPF